MAINEGLKRLSLFERKIFNRKKREKMREKLFSFLRIKPSSQKKKRVA